MKKLIALALAAVMVLSIAAASAATIPNVKDLGLERPEIPAMKCKNDGVTQTVTLSAPMSWLAGVWNWNWVNVDWTNEEHTAATLPMGGHTAAQGFGTWCNGLQEWTGYLDYKWIGMTTDKDSTEEDYKALDEAIAKAEKELMDNFKDGAYGKLETVHDQYDWGYFTTIESNPHFEYDVETDEKTGVTSWNGVKLMFDVDAHSSGTYDMGFAYDGATADGIGVRYDSHGRPVQETVTAEGTSYFGNGVSTKTTVVWTRQKNDAHFKAGYSYGWYVWYVSSITEEYEDGSKITANYAMNGKAKSAYLINAAGEKTWLQTRMAY